MRVYAFLFLVLSGLYFDAAALRDKAASLRALHRITAHGPTMGWPPALA